MATLPDVVEVGMNKASTLILPSPVQNIVIGNEAIANVQIDPETPHKIFIIARSLGSTNIIFMDDKGATIHQVEVRVSEDSNSVKAAIKELLPDESIGVSVHQGTIFLTGKVRSAASLTDAVTIARRFAADDASVINMLSLQGSQQVILQVKVAEISRTVRKELTTGLALTKTFPGGRGKIGQLIRFWTGRIGGDSPSTTITPTSTPFATGNIDPQISGLGQATFDILERQGLVKTLAEPTLMAVSGEPASFLAGGQTPIPSGVSSDGTATCCDYVEYGISLSFVPVIIDEGRISLNINTSISELGTTVTIGGSTAYNITEKSAQTTVELPSGGFVMMAGLLKDDFSETINGFPYLKDIPILGALFRSSEFLKEESELVITVTAYLAKPTGPGTPMALPTDGFEPASDIDFYLLGRLHREYAKGELPIWAKTIKGPFGYIME